MRCAFLFRDCGFVECLACSLRPFCARTEALDMITSAAPRQSEAVDHPRAQRACGEVETACFADGATATMKEPYTKRALPSTATPHFHACVLAADSVIPSHSTHRKKSASVCRFSHCHADTTANTLHSLPIALYLSDTDHVHGDHQWLSAQGR